MKYNPELIGTRIKEARLLKDYTIKELAELVGISDSTISRYENGKVGDVKLPIITTISKALNVDSYWILGLTDDRSVKTSDVSYELYPYIPDPVAAGIPTTIEGVLELPKIPIPDAALGRYSKRKDLIIMRASGESMNKVIQNGALMGVITDINVLDLKNGDLVVFNHEYEYSVKRFFRIEDKLVFRPDSTDLSFTDIIYTIDDNVEIVGKVIMSNVNYD